MHDNVTVATPEADFARPDPEVVSRLAALPVANIGDAMDRLGLLDSRIQAIWPGARLAGAALTVWTRAGDNAALHEALAIAKPGDVIVVNGQGDETRALLGDLIGAKALARGVAGFVLDGAARDAESLGDIGMPVFARACTPAGPYKFGPGRVGVPVAVGGVSVNAGDVVVGDGDGVAVIARDEAERVAEAAQAVFDDEARRRAAIPAPLASVRG
ncbi:methyltransferase [Knoellia koreensis]|uniref:Putative 4-hydroxy-4-methyl-2-oxoglutarate aldolase n=1 Tax=Knoellia koreensis TaxID=2730921 RepID=A0A849HHS0_9MICO|nr:methyltransferase [Knoellia sp. DB2414S]NNM46759.1 methyltransferase [Knoellia sp. DB2414S]